MKSDPSVPVAVIGSGAMGSGIAQVAAAAGHPVLVYDSNADALKRAIKGISASLDKLVEKQKISKSKADETLSRIKTVKSIDDLSGVGLVIEAIVENLQVKKELFTALEKVVSADCLLASNTSSLSITSIAAACQNPLRMLGIHFFNPPTIMALVEIIPGIATDSKIPGQVSALINSWGKTTVIAKDTPGFIVNRVARPFYSEALRIFDEGIADLATIDWAMKEIGGFRMGPFELMDMIGHDVNYVVTETVWTQLYFDPRFKPSLTQKRLLEAGFLGRKSGRGFYDYTAGANMPAADRNAEKGQMIVNRILAMLINEAADTVYLGIASAKDVDLAMTKGVNYPKGLLQWSDEKGASFAFDELARLYDQYQEERYRSSPLLRKKREMKETFH